MKNQIKLSSILLCLATIIAYQPLFAQRWIATPPGWNEPCKIDKTGRTVIPNGRVLTPAGTTVTTAPHPFGLILSPDGKTAVTANSGIVPFSISIIRNIDENTPLVQQIPEGAKNDGGILEACFMGLAISPDGNTLYVAGGDANKVFMFDLATGQKSGEIDGEFKDSLIDFSHGYLGDLTLSKKGILYVLDQIGFRILVIDALQKKLLANIPTGRYPYGIALSPDEKKLFVANVGMFEYKTFTDIDPGNLKGTAHDWPSTRYGSKEMIEGIPEKGVPPLGDPNDLKANSVWVYDLSNPALPQVRAKIKTGFLVGEVIEDFPAVGGASPNSIVATSDLVFVSNGNNDCISVIDINRDVVLKQIRLQPDARLGELRGIIPFGLALSPDHQRLFVAESGINAIGVIDIPTLKVIGHIPTGWFPSKLQVTPDGKKIVVANAKGFGSGPNGGKDFEVSSEGSYIGALMKGTVSIIDIPDETALKAMTEKVMDNNFIFNDVEKSNRLNPIPLFPGQQESPIKYIVFLAKENRTYDEVFGQVKAGKGDASLARWGVNRLVFNRNRSLKIRRADVMPNHLALAKQFAMSDNYYCDSDVSADGHRWMVNTYPNEWCETSTAASYGGKRDLVEGSTAPGNLGIYGSAGSIYPEDYNEAGSMWDHLERHGKDFFNFGFGVEMAAAYSDSTMKYIGELYTVNYPLPTPLYDRSSRIFPTYNMAIPDQFRFDLFKKEFSEKWIGEGKNMPQMVTLMLPNDHGAGERPHAGYPFQASYMADNDLAVGRAVEFLTHTPYWKNMAIFIIEDDPQGGVDHVDAHRSLMMLISPYVKRGYIGHSHYSFGSLFKTFWHILGIPYLNQYDATAAEMSDLFTNEPDYTPYNAIAADKRIFDPQKALDPHDEKFDWKAFSKSEELDRVEDMQKRRAEDDLEEKRNRRKKQ